MGVNKEKIRGQNAQFFGEVKETTVKIKETFIKTKMNMFQAVVRFYFIGKIH